MKIRRVILSMLLVFGMLVALPAEAQGASVAKKSVKRDIAIVFDNSGSMYMNGNKAWCQATYAMEVFASMMNEGDVLKIYPMSEIKVDSTTYTSQDPLVISDPSEAVKIRKIFTPKGGDTFISTIDAAYEGQMKSKADEQWLIVLTDGANFYEPDEVELNTTKTKERLTEVLSEYAEKVHTLYLGIGDVAAVPEIKGKYANEPVKAKSEEVPEKLSVMCNTIFGRDALPTENQTSDRITFDIPLSKLIVFAQGDNISVTLEGKKESSALTTKASELGAGNYEGVFGKAPELQGVINTYESVPAGSYKLTFTGNPNSVSIYYEPDADLSVQLLDAAGVPVSGGDVYSGDYSLVYAVTDSNGNDISSSKLLGKTTYDIDLLHNGKAVTLPVKDKAGSVPIMLSGGDKLELKSAKVTFLKDYTITKSGAELGFPEGGFSIQTPANTLKLEVTGGRDSYLMSELEAAGVYEVKAVYNGAELAAPEFAKIKFDPVTVTGGTGGGNPVAGISTDGNKAVISLKYNGSAADTCAGDQEFIVKASYTDQYGDSTTAGVKVPFTVEADTLELAVAGGQPNYQMSELEDKGVYEITALLNGTKLTAEEFAGMTFGDIAVAGGEGEGNPEAAISVNGDSAALNLLYNTDAAHTNTGEQEITVNAVYTDASGAAVPVSAVIPFAVAMDTRKLAADLIIPEDYYLLKDLGDDTFLKVKVMVDGEKLTDEELDAIAEAGTLQITAESGLSLDTEITPVHGESAFTVGMLKKGSKKGLHKVTCEVSMPSSRSIVYEPARDTARVNIRTMPLWLQWLIIGLIVLAVAGLIAFIMTRKILPKDMFVLQSETTFSCDGDQVNGFKQIRYGKKNIFGRILSKETALVILSQPDGNGRPITSVTLKIKPNATIKDVLFAKDSCTVLANMKSDPASTVTDITLKNVIITYDEDQRHFVDDRGKLATTRIIEMRNGTMVGINETTTESDLSYSTKVHIKW